MADDVIAIEDLRKQYQDKIKTKDLKAFADKQQEVIMQLLQQREELIDKVKHLESMLSNIPNLQSNKLSSEEIICMEQIHLLKTKSDTRELSLDEIKRLDLLVKNLRLIREQSTQVITTTDYSDIKESELVSIARGITE